MQQKSERTLISPPLLIVLSGLPGVGKTWLARELSRHRGMVHLRIDTIEARMQATGIVAAAGGWDAFPDAGYQVAYALAEDFLRASQSVIADSVNPVAITREAWNQVAIATNAQILNIEVICSDVDRHRMRVENRVSDIPGFTVPTWDDVTARHFDPWPTKIATIDTAGSREATITQLLAIVDNAIE